LVDLRTDEEDEGLFVEIPEAAVGFWTFNDLWRRGCPLVEEAAMDGFTTLWLEDIGSNEFAGRWYWADILCVLSLFRAPSILLQCAVDFPSVNGAFPWINTLCVLIVKRSLLRNHRLWKTVFQYSFRPGMISKRAQFWSFCELNLSRRSFSLYLQIILCSGDFCVVN
jgi:hypothetical protein